MALVWSNDVFFLGIFWDGRLTAENFNSSLTASFTNFFISFFIFLLPKSSSTPQGQCLGLSYQRTGLLEELCLVELVASQGPLEWGRVLSLLVGPVVHLLETESMGRFFSKCNGHPTGISESSRHPSPFCSMTVPRRGTSIVVLRLIHGRLQCYVFRR